MVDGIPRPRAPRRGGDGVSCAAGTVRIVVAGGAGRPSGTARLPTAARLDGGTARRRRARVVVADGRSRAGARAAGRDCAGGATVRPRAAADARRLAEFRVPGRDAGG